MGKIHDKVNPRIANIHHNLEEYPRRNIGILLPVGLFLHSEAQEARIGDKIKTADGKLAVIIAKQELAMNSGIANAISMQIYNRPIKYVAALMHQNWGDEMDENIVLYLVVKPE